MIGYWETARVQSRNFNLLPNKQFPLKEKILRLRLRHRLYYHKFGNIKLWNLVSQKKLHNSLAKILTKVGKKIKKIENT